MTEFSEGSQMHRLKSTLEFGILLGTLCITSVIGLAQLHIPNSVQAGTDAMLQTPGSGSTTLYLFGPDGASNRKVERGTIRISGDELQTAGRYTAIVDGKNASFFVTAARPEKIAFIAHPSRVPTDARNAISGTAVLFDRFQNLALAPTPISFHLAAEGNAESKPDTERTVTSKDGIAWVQMGSGKHSGAAQFTASIGSLEVRRVVQQVAADPCAIRMRANPAPDGNILVETDPIRDCSGNAVPDGTIVTFASVDASGRSTVDARIKQGFARAELPASSNATLTVAAGVVLGNQIHWGAGQ